MDPGVTCGAGVMLGSSDEAPVCFLEQPNPARVALAATCAAH